jgi:YYY domain-containing protein
VHNFYSILLAIKCSVGAVDAGTVDPESVYPAVPVERPMEYGLVVLWFVVYAGLAALALPLVAWLVPRAPDRGAGLALPAALAVLGVVGYWVGRVAFGLPALAVGLLVLAAGSGLAYRRGARPDLRRFGEATAVFAVAFLFLVWVRALDPAVHPGGGEKFLDFGLLSVLLRSGTLPPEDPWFAGEPVQYYYGGHAVAALLATLTDTPARYAYNLSLAGFYGALVTAAYTAAGALADGRGHSRRSAGLFAAFLVAVASNLVTPLRFLAWAVPGGSALAGAFGVETTGLATGPDAFGYWSASRVIPGTINEFPFFAFLNGDLHAHMMSTPFLLLVVATLYAYWRTPAAAVGRRRALVVGVVPVLAGLLAVVNTWSFPTVLGLTALALAGAPADPRGLVPVSIPTPDLARTDGGVVDADGLDGEADAGAWLPAALDEAVRVVVALAVVGVVAALGVAVTAPFFLGSTGGRGLGLFPARSTLSGLLVVHGVFLAVTARHLLPAVDPGPGARERAIALTGLLALGAVAFGVVAPLPFALVVLAGWLAVRTGRTGFETVLAVGAAGLVVLVEFAYVTNAGFPGRYNTVFKIYEQVWVLWATAAGVMLARHVDPAGAVEALAGRVRRRRSARADGGDGGSGAGRPAVGAVLAAALVVSLSLYAGLALANHTDRHTDPATLDSLRFVDRDHPGEAEAITWLRDREGTPTIATAPTLKLYRWDDTVGGSAPASLTGLPTLAGWAHERGYRGDETWDRRVETVRRLYGGTPRERVRVLSEHDVEYVYVGPAERLRYRVGGFEELRGLSVVHESGDVVIYRVDHGALGVPGSE